MKGLVCSALVACLSGLPVASFASELDGVDDAPAIAARYAEIMKIKDDPNKRITEEQRLALYGLGSYDTQRAANREPVGVFGVKKSDV